MNKKNNKIPTKNYIIIGMLFLISFVLILLGGKWYKNYRQYQLTIPVISGYINEVGEQEIDNYLLENNDTMIYIGKSDDNNCRSLEKDLKKFIKKHNLREKIIYIDLNKVNNKDSFIEKFNNKYATNEKIDKYPTFIIIENSKILDLVSKTKAQGLYIGDIEQLLDEYELLGD